MQNLNLDHRMQEEYKTVKHDLFRVLVLNAIYLAGLLALYYTNKSSGYLDQFFARLFNF